MAWPPRLCARLLVLTSPHPRGWPARLVSAQGLALPPRLCSAACRWPHLTLGMATSPALGCMLLASPHSWHSRLAFTRLLAVELASHSWHDRLACARLLAAGLASLLAWAPRLCSAACCWPRLTRVAGQHAWYRLKGLALPPRLHSAAFCWPCLTLGTAASPALGCVLGLASLLAWPPRLPALGCAL